MVVSGGQKQPTIKDFLVFQTHIVKDERVKETYSFLEILFTEEAAQENASIEKPLPTETSLFDPELTSPHQKNMIDQYW